MQKFWTISLPQMADLWQLCSYNKHGPPSLIGWMKQRGWGCWRWHLPLFLLVHFDFLMLQFPFILGLMEGVNQMALQLASQWQYCARRYGIAEEGVQSHCLPFGGVRVDGFNIQWRCNGMAKISSFWFERQQFCSQPKYQMRCQHQTKMMVRTLWPFILSTQKYPFFVKGKNKYKK